MGGEYLPNSFLPAPADTWQLLTKIINQNDWYRFVSVTCDSPSELRLRDGNEHIVVPVDDETVEIFRRLKGLGENAAIVLDRLFERCYVSIRTGLDSFLDYSMTVDDIDCDSGEWPTKSVPSSLGR